MNLYARMLQNKYGVSTQSPKFKGNGKWSDRAKATFAHQGKGPGTIKLRCKLKLAVAPVS